jgi:hypothetical protein
LNVKENALRRYILLRYNFSAIDYFYKKFIVKETEEGNSELPLLDKITIFDTELNGIISLKNYFEMIKMLFKNLLTLYKQKNQIEDGYDYQRIYFKDNLYYNENDEEIEDNSFIEEKIYLIIYENGDKIYKKRENSS